MRRASRVPSNGPAWGGRIEPLEGRLLLAATVPPGFADTPLAAGLSQPTSMAFAPDGRLFVTQQGGSLRVVKNGALLTTPFLSVTTTTNGERGLLGVEFDPNFASNGYVYVYYTRPTASSVFNQVSRFTADPANPDVALAGSELPLLALDPLSAATNHNGGALHFGPDGKLYVAVGDNANGANAQSFTSFKGKILRLNADGSAPADNPFYDAGDGITARDYTWAMGLRNPYTFAFQPGTGRMYINDVGEVTFEEVNEGLPGRNFGWPQTEGGFDPATFPQYTNPIYFYRHGGTEGGGGFAITGGAFYNPATPQFPASYVGDYFYGDFVGNYIRDLEPPAGLDLHGGHVIRANIDYDGTTLNVALRDLTTGDTNNQSYTVNIPGTLITEDNQGWVGFTGASGGLTAVQDILNWTYTPGGAATLAIDYGPGFGAGQGLTSLGSAATTTDGRLRLTSGATNQKSNVYFSSRVDVTNFHTQFDFQLTRALADGFTFIVQDNGPTVTGVGGSGLGSQGILYSVAIKFDIGENDGEGVNSTGMYLNGAEPTTPARRITVTPASSSPFASNAAGPVDLDVGPDGALYYLAYGGGSVGRISYTLDTAGPRVSQVIVNRAAWPDAFKVGFGSAVGYRVPGGAGQSLSLPWAGLDRIQLVFNEPIDPASLQQPGLLSLLGTAQASYPVSFVGYDAASRTATWSINMPGGLSRGDRLRIVLGDGVADPAGNRLDGEWANGQAYPSGNGSPGGGFQFNFNVLPGDATRDGRVDALDELDVRRRLFRSTANPGGSGATAYSVFADVTANGVVDAADFAFVRQRIANRLPQPQAVFSAAQILTAVIAARREDELRALLS